MEVRHLCGPETEVIIEKVTENCVLRGEECAKDPAVLCLEFWCWYIYIYILRFVYLFTGEMMMTLRHSFNFCAQYAKIQNVLYFLFCSTLRAYVVDANSETENWWGVTHITLAKVRTAAIWFSCGSTGFFPTKMGLIYLHKKIKLFQLTWNRNNLIGNNH